MQYQFYCCLLAAELTGSFGTNQKDGELNLATVEEQTKQEGGNRQVARIDDFDRTGKGKIVSPGMVRGRESVRDLLVFSTRSLWGEAECMSSCREEVG